MTYTPNEWQRGDVVTSEKLNHMEQGIAESGGGWDACLEFLFYGEHAENPSVQFAFGSYDALKEKYDAGKLPMICFNDELLRTYIYDIEKVVNVPDVDPDSLSLNVERSYTNDFVQCIIQPDNTILHGIFSN